MLTLCNIRLALIYLSWPLFGKDAWTGYALHGVQYTHIRAHAS